MSNLTLYVRLTRSIHGVFFLFFAKSRFNNPDESAEIYENEPSGTVVKRLQARSTSSLLFELVEGDMYSLFTVNPSTGVLITKRQLDYESCHVYNLSVTATNMVRVSRDSVLGNVEAVILFKQKYCTFTGRFQSHMPHIRARARQKRQFTSADQHQLQGPH